LRTKVLFLFSIRTLVEESPINKVFLNPGAITYLGRIATELFYDLILVTNQVSLGTESIPRVLFNEAHKFILKTFEGEGIHLSSIYIATSKKTSNTGIGMISIYNRSQSFVIVRSQFTRGIIVRLQEVQTFSWKKIYKLLKFCFSESSYRRRSKETDIQIFIKIDGKGISYIHTGFGFFDHLLDQICIHAAIDLGLKVKGDFYVDEHHTIEDTAIALGIALSKTLKDKRGVARYGFLLPMDDAIVQVALDLGGRSNMLWKAYFEREKIGDVPTEMFEHFFKSFSDVAYCNLNIKAEGDNEHHKIEAIFKAFACVLNMATKRGNNDRLPSTKEIL